MGTPPIHYVRTKDGIDLAYWTLGDGDPVVWVNDSNGNHAEGEWRSDWHRRWYEALAAHRLLVKFDARGTGLSSRQVDDYTLPARVSDVEAVVEALELERIALVAAMSHAGPVAIQYAVDHPDTPHRSERVRRGSPAA